MSTNETISSYVHMSFLVLAQAQLESVKETLLTLPEEVIKDIGLEATTPTSGEAAMFHLHGS